MGIFDESLLMRKESHPLMVSMTIIHSGILILILNSNTIIYLLYNIHHMH